MHLRLWILAFVVGVCAAQTLSELPPVSWLLAIVLLTVLSIRWRWLRLPCAVALGFAWAVIRSAWLLQTELPAELEGRVVTVTGTIIELPESLGEVTRFQLRSEFLQLGGRKWPSCGIVRLDWRTTAVPGPGQRWSLQVRLKRPHGFRNPGGFDYELWLLQNRIRATGHVIDNAVAQRLPDSPVSIDRLRAGFGEQLREAIGFHPLHGVVEALAIGDRSGISDAQREVFNRTNTGHLIAISGLHIGLVAAIGFFVARWMWTLPLRTLHWIPAQRIGALGSVMAAAVYCALAGFDVPAQRTLIMIAVVAASLWQSRTVSSLDTLCTALAVVVIYDPLAVTEVGFWLSFVAVSLLMYACSDVIAANSLWRQLTHAHLAMAVGLAPLMVLLFGTLSLVGPLANFVAVPWVSFVVVPLTLLGTFTQSSLPLFGYWLLRGALLALDLLWPLLHWLAALPAAELRMPYPGIVVFASSCIAVMFALMPRGLPGRVLAAAWLAPLLLHAPPRPTHGEFEATVLDVGQGLSVAVLTQTHVLIFDSGPVFSDRFNAGSAVVRPFLRFHGVSRIDTLILSHGDSDHVGGAPALIAAFGIGRTLSSVPEKLQYAAAEACVAGQSWQWDGVSFRVLGPSGKATLTGNDASCVLRIENGNGTRSVLLTGDIEADGERALLASQRKWLASTLVVAPHHGSASSSTAAFVAATRPQLVAFAVGYRNRWRFPNAQVAERWRQAGAAALRTDDGGALIWRSDVDGSAVQQYRRTYRRYWHDAVQPGAAPDFER